MCQDYMFSISKDVEPMTVRNADVRLVIISNGSHSMIKSYRRVFISILFFGSPVNSSPPLRNIPHTIRGLH